MKFVKKMRNQNGASMVQVLNDKNIGSRVIDIDTLVVRIILIYCSHVILFITGMYSRLSFRLP